MHICFTHIHVYRHHPRITSHGIRIIALKVRLLQTRILFFHHPTPNQMGLVRGGRRVWRVWRGVGGWGGRGCNCWPPASVCVFFQGIFWAISQIFGEYAYVNTHTRTHIHMNTDHYVCMYVCIYVCVCVCVYIQVTGIGWLWLVGFLKLQVSFAEYSLFYRALLQKIPIIFRSKRIIATP